MKSRGLILDVLLFFMVIIRQQLTAKNGLPVTERYATGYMDIRNSHLNAYSI